MKRRKFLAGMGASLAVPFAFAQPSVRVPRIAILSVGSHESLGYNVEAFKRSMHELGYAEGKTVVFEIRWGMGKTERLPGLARELVELGPDVILTGNVAATFAARQATTTIPIVMATNVDPVGSGLIKSLARPGGNITGLSNMAVDLGPKLFDLLLTAVPGTKHLAVLVNPDNPGHAPLLDSIRAGAKPRGIRVLTVNARSLEEIEAGFSMMAREKAGGLIVALDGIFNNHTRRIAELAAKHRLPSIAGWPQYAEANGLMSYGHNMVNNWRRAASYVDRILKGAAPAEMPVEQPTTFELVINLKAAQEIGLKIPQSMQLRADRVIE